MRKAALSLTAGLLLSLSLSATAATRYVDVNNSVPAPPYTNWSTAATSIQAAVDAAQAGDTVLVTNGVYATGGRAVYGTMTNRVSVDKFITLLSVNGPQFTVITGYQVPGMINGDGAIRCVYLTNGAVVSGFTLTNGATRDSGDYLSEQSGGGVWCESDTALVTNCTLTGNSAYSYGGGACSGTLNNCTLTGNSAGYGGGAYSGTLNDCTLMGNSAGSGGGTSYGTLNNCTLTDNLATGIFGGGGGAYSGTLNNCTLTGNSAYSYGGGAYTGTLNNCTLTGNSAQDGGGASSGTLSNCTLTNNSALEGGGTYTGTLNNCTLTGNSAAGGGGTIYGTLSNCTLTGNSAYEYGGGAYQGTLNNCTLTGNSAVYGGGAYSGTLNNCTLTGNSAQDGGGAYSGTVKNCILYYNTANSGANYDINSTLNYCCTTPVPGGGSGNFKCGAATGQRLPPQRRFAVSRGRQRRLRDRCGY